MSTGCALGIDLGTSGVRAVVVDGAGAQVAAAAAPLAAAARADPAAWWTGVATCLDALGRAPSASGALAALRAVAVDGTSGSVLGVDAGGVPIGPAAMYNEPAEPGIVAAIAAVAPPGSAARGAASPLARLVALAVRPGVVRLLHQADWIAFRLGAPLGVSDANNALKSGYDPLAEAWPAWIEGLGLSRALLPEVVRPGTVTGMVRAGLGLPSQAAVVAGTTDGCAAFLATGAATAGEAVSSLGSTLTVKLLSDRPVFAPDYGIYSHRLGDAWLAGGASNSGGAVLARFFDPPTLAALSARIDPAQESGLDYYPLAAPGERFPIADPALPPRLAPRPADDAAFLHGLLEGIARIEALGYRRLADLGAPPVASLRSVGGGARNPAFTAIRARLLGVPMLPSRAQEAAHGTALLALRAVA